MNRAAFVFIVAMMLPAGTGVARAQDLSAGTALTADILAPTGTLRAAFLGTNPVQGRIDADTGEVSGPVADLVAELSRRLDVPHEFLPAFGGQAAQEVISLVNSGAADIGFLAYEAARAEQVDYTGPYALMMSSYLVARDSPLQNSADADSVGRVIGAVRARSQEIHLSNTLTTARLEIYEQEPEESEISRLLTSGELDAFALNRQTSVEMANAMPELRVVGDSFLDVPQAFVVRKGETAKAGALEAFVDELRASGFIEMSLSDAGLLGAVGVAPPGLP